MLGATRYLSLASDPAGMFAAAFSKSEDAFFAGIRTSNGTFKTTAHRRLDAMTDLTFDVLSRHGIVPRVVMDIGISSGITTLEWLRGFEQRGIAVTMIATDRTISTYLAEIGGGLSALLEPNGHLLQLDYKGRGIRCWLRRRDYLTGSHLWRRALIALTRRSLLARGVSFPLEPGAVRAHGAAWRVTGPFPLVTPALRARSDVRLMDDDILLPPPPDLVGSADVIRVANVLQRVYFSETQLHAVAANLTRRSRGPGSIIILCRNREAALEGSILKQRTDGTWEAISRLDPGSEAERYFTEPGSLCLGEQADTRCSPRPASSSGCAIPHAPRRAPPRRRWNIPWASRRPNPERR
jgi:hypothetical protein